MKVVENNALNIMQLGGKGLCRLWIFTFVRA